MNTNLTPKSIAIIAETYPLMVSDRGRLEGAMAALPQVVEVSDVSGDVDYILKIVVANMAEWNRLREQLTRGDLGVERVTTHVLVRKPKIFVGYPVPDR